MLLSAQNAKLANLKKLRWLPVLTNSPSEFLPWPDFSFSSLAKPNECKCGDQQWLCSYNYRLVVEQIHSPELKKILGLVSERRGRGETWCG